MPQRVQLPSHAYSRIRQMVIKNPEVTIDTIMEKLGDDAPTRFLVSVIRENAMATVKEAKKLGKLRE